MEYAGADEPCPAAERALGPGQLHALYDILPLTARPLYDSYLYARLRRACLVSEIVMTTPLL